MMHWKANTCPENIFVFILNQKCNKTFKRNFAFDGFLLYYDENCACNKKMCAPA